MNKQEALKLVEQMGEYERFVDELVSKKSVLNIISQIDGSQKVVIPKFVADKIEYCKETYGYSLFRAMNYCYMHIGSDAAEWLEYNEEIFSSAWFDGYEIEKKEKLYTVEIPNPQNRDGNLIVLTRNIHNNVVIDKTSDIGWKRFQGNQLTEAEIKKDFAWAWNAGFAEEVEDETEK